VLNNGNPHIAGLKAHEEQPSLKGYSEEGARAAKDSVIHYEPPARAVSDWLATFYHRIPLLQPSLEEVGLGYASDKKHWGCVMDCMSGTVPKGGKEIVFYPDDGQKNVPTTFCDEAPTPLPSTHSGEAGFPVTVTLTGDQSVKQVAITLSGPDGAIVPAHVSTPESPARRDFPQWNTVCLIPKQKLAARKTYMVKFASEVGGKTFSRSWSFTTGSRK
jgi:hypothetical protein